MADYLTTDTELTSVANAIRTKGGTSSSLVYPTGFVSAINAIPTGGGGTDVSDTTAVAGDVLSGKYFHIADGTKVQGTIASKTSSDVTTNNNVVTIPAGHYASQVQKTVGTAQAAQTIHPSSSDQTIASGKYLTGAQTIKGVVCTNLTAGNIKNGVTVKIGDSTDDDCVTSVTGTYEGGGGGITLKRISGTGKNTVSVSGWGANDFTKTTALNQNPPKILLCNVIRNNTVYTLCAVDTNLMPNQVTLVGCASNTSTYAVRAQFTVQGSILNYTSLKLNKFYEGSTDYSSTVGNWEIYSNTPSVAQFSFVIEFDGAPVYEYTADDGMTWEMWIESPYNEDVLFQMDGEYVLYDDGNMQAYVCDSNGDPVTINSQITENETYQLMTM